MSSSLHHHWKKEPKEPKEPIGYEEFKSEYLRQREKKGLTGYGTNLSRDWKKRKKNLNNNTDNNTDTDTGTRGTCRTNIWTSKQRNHRNTVFLPLAIDARTLLPLPLHSGRIVQPKRPIDEMEAMDNRALHSGGGATKRNKT